jgi:hypothetical protein
MLVGSECDYEGGGMEGEHVLDTEGEVGVEVVLAFARVGECDLVESDDGRRQLADVFKVESVWRRGWLDHGKKNERHTGEVWASRLFR